jgi:hypothetical protein
MDVLLRGWPGWVGGGLQPLATHRTPPFWGWPVVGTGVRATRCARDLLLPGAGRSWGRRDQSHSLRICVSFLGAGGADGAGLEPLTAHGRTSFLGGRCCGGGSYSHSLRMNFLLPGLAVPRPAKGQVVSPLRLLSGCGDGCDSWGDMRSTRCPEAGRRFTANRRAICRNLPVATCHACSRERPRQVNLRPASAGDLCQPATMLDKPERLLPRCAFRSLPSESCSAATTVSLRSAYGRPATG